MTTFTDPGEAPAPRSPDTPIGEEPPDVENGNDKLRVKVKLTSINLILNEDGFRLATLSLSAGDVSVLLRSPTMRIAARLGNLTFVDDFSADEPKEMLSIQGDEVADLQYETFDPTESGTYPGYDTSVYLRSGSFKFTFNEEPVHRILVFFSKFARMKAVYDAATAAAAQRATEVSTMIPKMHYDIIISTPIVVFPRDEVDSKDIVTANLGEISVKNKFEVSRDTVVTKINAGLREIRLTTTIYSDGKANSLQILEDVEINVDLTMTQSVNPTREIDVPATLVSGAQLVIATSSRLTADACRADRCENVGRQDEFDTSPVWLPHLAVQVDPARFRNGRVGSGSRLVCRSRPFASHGPSESH